MHFLLTAFVVAASLVAATRAEEPSLDRPGLAIRSDLMSCEETYGDGWNVCGDEVRPTPSSKCRQESSGLTDGQENSKFCYSPLLGQVSAPRLWCMCC